MFFFKKNNDVLKFTAQLLANRLFSLFHLQQ